MHENKRRVTPKFVGSHQRKGDHVRRQVNRRTRGRGLFKLSAIAATAAVVGALYALPAFASANALSLRLEPPVPKADERFNMIANGTLTGVPDPIEAYWLTIGPAPAGGPCASTKGLQFPPGTAFEQFNPDPGLLDERHAFEGLDLGRYKACGYLSGVDKSSGWLLLASYGFEFTIGGTCDGATKKTNKARRQQKKAKKQKEKAHREKKKSHKSGNKNRTRKARKQFKRKSTKLKKKNSYLKKKKEDRKALCPG